MRRVAEINPGRKSRRCCTAPTRRYEHAGTPGDVVLDCTDNNATRHAGKACVAHRRPLVSGAAIRSDGQISVYDSHSGDLPACVFPEAVAFEETRLRDDGVFAPLVGIIGTCKRPRRSSCCVGSGYLAGRAAR